MKHFFILLLLVSSLSKGQMIINASKPYTSVFKTKLLIDSLSINNKALLVLSTRKIVQNYTGSLIRVRRTSDNAEQDIGYTITNELDTAALKTFIGSNDAYLTKWYDQSGNGYNATQTTTTYQPKIASAGVLLYITNGRVAAQGVSTGVGMNIDYHIKVGTTKASFLAVAKTVSGIGCGCIIRNFSNCGGCASHQPYCNRGFYEAFGVSTRRDNIFSKSTALLTAPYQYGALSAANDWRAFFNGNNEYTTTTNTFNYDNTTNPVVIFGPPGDASGETVFSGWISEILVFSDVYSTGDLSLIYNSQKGYFKTN